MLQIKKFSKKWWWAIITGFGIVYGVFGIITGYQTIPDIFRVKRKDEKPLQTINQQNFYENNTYISKDTSTKVLPKPSSILSDSLAIARRNENLNDTAVKPFNLDWLKQASTNDSVKTIIEKTEVVSKNELNSGYGTSVEMSESPPLKDHGKLILRLTCDHCYYGSVSVHLLNADSSDTGIWGNVRTNFKPLDKWGTSYTKNLLPGKYIIEFDFRDLGKSYKNIQITEKAFCIYHFTIKNRFGGKNGQVVFYSHKSEQFKLTIDKVEKGTFTFSPTKGFSIILPFGYHDIILRRPETNNVHLDTTFRRIYLYQGQRYPYNVTERSNNY